VDAGSDIVRPIHGSTFPDRRWDTKHAGDGGADEKVLCESPVEILNPDHSRSLSTSTVSTTRRTRSDLEDLRLGSLNVNREWSVSSNDVGCASGRSFDSEMSSSAEGYADAYVGIQEFDSLMRAELPEIRVQRAFRGRQSLLHEFDFSAPRPEQKKRGGPSQRFAFNFHPAGGSAVASPVDASPMDTSRGESRLGKSLRFGELRRLISSLMRSGKQGSRAEQEPLADSRQESVEDQTHNKAGESSAHPEVPSFQSPPRTGRKYHRPGGAGDNVEFMVLIPQ